MLLLYRFKSIWSTSGKQATIDTMKTVPKVALVCDWLTEVGGAERVIQAVHAMYPDAPIYTSQYRPSRAVWFAGADVRTGWLNIFPAKLKRFIPFLRQLYFSRLDLSKYDLVISITGAEAKAVKTRPGAVHVSYMHAPTQYYWTLYDQYVENPGFGILNPLARLGLKLLVRLLRRADYAAAQRPTVIVSNSSYIQDEIKKYYDRDSTVIWPNVDVEGIQKLSLDIDEGAERDGFIIYGRQVSWKRIDIAVEAAKRSGEKLVVAGDGPEHDRLVSLAAGADNIKFLPRYNGVGEIMKYVRASKAYIFPSLEPFGIAAVEALAAGTPVVALRKGGALDFVDQKNGVFFEEQTTDSLEAALEEISTKSFDYEEVARSANKFSEASFRKSMSSLIEKSMKDVSAGE
jgi:glycosyltransferase involved in cell wall biosynthesis